MSQAKQWARDERVAFRGRCRGDRRRRRGIAAAGAWPRRAACRCWCWRRAGARAGAPGRSKERLSARSRRRVAAFGRPQCPDATRREARVRALPSPARLDDAAAQQRREPDEEQSGSPSARRITGRSTAPPKKGRTDRQRACWSRAGAGTPCSTPPAPGPMRLSSKSCRSRTTTATRTAASTGACGDGYGTLLEALAEGLPIAFDTKVTRIDHRGRDIVLDTSRGQVAAARVIVAVPTAILAGSDLVFDPALPGQARRRQRAAARACRQAVHGASAATWPTSIRPATSFWSARPAGARR